MRSFFKKGLSIMAAATIAMTGGSMTNTVAEDATRNVAFRRAAIHSTAADYDHTGHLVTDGIISNANTWKLTGTDQYADNPAGEGVANLFDGTTDTKWLTFHNTAYVQLAFPNGEAYTAASYVVASANDEANRDPVAWTLQGSADGVAFVDLDSRTGQDFPSRFEKKAYTIASDKQAAYTYYRLKITKNSGDYRTQLSEWDLLDSEGNTLLRPFGEVFNSVWISKGAGQQWVAVDLGGVSRISSANVYWANENRATSYQLQISNDSKNWRTVATCNNREGGMDTLTFDAVEAAWVRVLCTAAAKENYQLSELEVYGTNSVNYTLPEQPAPAADGTQAITGGNWTVQRASEVSADGEQLSTAFDDSDWLPATVPGTVLTSYLNAGAIVDPNVANNQLQISDSFFTTDFWYRNSFVIPKSQEGKRTWLNFDAINWKADVYFNGVDLGSIEGAFIRGRFDITDLAKYGEENYLAVFIHKNEHPGIVTEQTLQSAGPNGGILGADNPTIHASIGWDWVPTIRGRNVGIYGDVFLSYTEDVVLQNSWVVTDLNTDHTKATLTVKGELYNPAAKAVTVTVSGAIDGTDLTFESRPVTLAAGETKECTFATLTMNDPTLWWPNTYGEQHLYTMNLSAAVDGQVSDTESFAFGVREFTYSAGSPLQIYCNGTRIVCTGGNWGMDDANLACIAEDYDIKVRLHAEANFTMIRNWVGMTRNDAFYDACDKYGILIWDDFWLANPGDGPNPNDEALFMTNAADKVKRNRYHAALALYCGRNEGDPPATLNTALDALTKSADGTRHYIPHSAASTVSGFGPYSVQNPAWYFNNTPQTLHSERGMPNIPEYESLMAMLTEKYAWPINPVWGLHDFCTDSAQGLSSFTAAMEKYRKSNNLATFARTAQMVNYENHKAMFEAVHAANSNGLLMWMSQSAWPSMVWQTYDYYYETNAGYFAIKKANQPINAIWNSGKNVLQLSNATAEKQEDLIVVLNIFDLAGTLIHEEEQVVTAPAGTTTALLRVPDLKEKSAVQFIETFVYDQDGREISRNFYWRNVETYQDYTALSTLPKVKPTLSYRLLIKENGVRTYALTVSNTGDTPLLMLRLKTATETGERVLPTYYSDNYLSLMPGESQIITVEFAEKYLNGGDPVFSAEGWNTELCSDFEQLNGVLGDVDSDGAITSTDARLTLQFCVDKVTKEDLDTTLADVDGDGDITTTDARLMLQRAVDKIDRFPAE